MRFFNTAGPVVPEQNYFIPPLDRIDRDELFRLIERWRYFVLHAPRQTGKTSALLALRDELNETGRYRAVYANVEIAQTAREDVAMGMSAIIEVIARRAKQSGDEFFNRVDWDELRLGASPHSALMTTLEYWSASDPRPAVLMIDEIDSLVGDTLISVLRQLRAGYPERPRHFPQSVILCGVRDVRDYRIHSSADKTIITGGSAFNIKAKSLRLDDFDESETRALLLQHTDATGQRWSEAALAEVWHSTQGQPWLVNALASEACDRVKDFGQTMEADDIVDAREELILRRDTHLDQLADKLREERVKRVIEPLLSDSDEAEGFRPDDVQYVQDLGLIARKKEIEIANPIYREVIPRELITSNDRAIPYKTAWFVQDGRLAMARLLESFQEFFREHSEHWVRRFDYQQSGSLLLLQAFLQRVVNAGGRIEREYGIGRMRTDLMVVWGEGDTRQKEVIECKLRRNGLERTIQEGLSQIGAYMERCGVDEGHMVVFDRSEKRSWDDKVFRREETVGDRRVTVWGM